MLLTGIKTPVGIKILGSDLDEIQRIGGEIGDGRSRSRPAHERGGERGARVFHRDPGSIATRSHGTD